MNWKKFMDEGDYQDFLLRALTVAQVYEAQGTYSIKKFVTQKGKVVLKPLNRSFSDIRIDSPDGYRIVGVFRENYQVETAGSN